MRFKHSIFILTISIVILLTTLTLILSLHRKDAGTPEIEIVHEAGNNVNVYVTRAQIRKEISPVTVKDLLAKTKISTKEDGKELTLVDFEDDSLLSRYGFKRGDVITAINGRGVGTIRDIIEVCDLLEKEIFEDTDEKEIDVSIVREGEDVDMNFRVPKFVPEEVRYTMRLEKRAGK